MENIPIQYLFRPEENSIRLSIDMKYPFKNTLTYGKERITRKIDVLETYAYLKGLAMRRRLRFDINKTKYMVIVSDDRVAIFRNMPDQDDTDILLKILKDTRITEWKPKQLDINFDINLNTFLGSDTLIQDVHIITSNDFEDANVWEK